MKELIQKVDNHDSRIERLEVLEGGGAVALQGTTPGTAQTGNANLTGTILAATMTATGTVQGATVNATSKVQLNGVTALEMGTSFPVSPATNQRYFRTDRLIDYVYDGTMWLSVQQFKLPFISRSAQPFAQAATVFDLNFSEYNLYGGIYIYAFNVSFFDNTAQDASNFYTLTLRYLNTSGVSSGITLGGTTDTKTFTTISRWYTLAPTFTPVALTSLVEMSAFFQLTPTLNPGTFFANGSLGYRLIG
jgi:hypothetical protein